MPSFLDEARAELALLEVIRGLDYEYAFGPDLAPDGVRPERGSYADVVLSHCFPNLRALGVAGG